jgi:hypothetical protein
VSVAPAHFAARRRKSCASALTAIGTQRAPALPWMRTDFFAPIDVATAETTWTHATPRIAFDCIRLLAVWVACVAPAVVATRFQYTWSLHIFIAPLALTTRDLHHRGCWRR